MTITTEYSWPMVRRSLEDYYEMVLRCGKCAYCRNVWPSNTRHEKFAFQCPRGEYHTFESYYASGTMEVARGLLEGELQWSDRLLDIIYTCNACGACEEWDQMTKRIYPLKVIREMKIQAVKDGKGPMPAHKEAAEAIAKTYNPFMEPHRQRTNWIPTDTTIPSKSDTIYFVGCNSSYRTKKISQAATRIMKNAGLDFGIMADEWCCGWPLFSTGLVEEGLKVMKHNLNALKAAGARKVVFTCPGCYKTFKEAEIYGLNRSDMNFEMQHISEFLLPLIGKNKFEFARTEARVAYHDPCELGRILKVYEPPREMLTAIPGIDMLELPRNRQNSWCCGAGSMVRNQYYDQAAWTAGKRFEEVRHVGAPALVTACPECVQHLHVEGSKQGIKVYDIVEIFARALKGGTVR